MKSRTFCFALLLVAMLVLLAPPMMGTGRAEPVSAQIISPAEMLNLDGSLKLDGRFHGALNISGYHVHMDPQRGPLFSSVAHQPTGSQTLAGNWDHLSGGGGVFSESVTAVAVSGSNVYIGGDFENAASIPEADYIVRWNGNQWSALGSNGAGDGSIPTSTWTWVNTLAVDSSGNLYVGGSFGNLNNHGTVLTAADAIAKWNGSDWSALGSNGAGEGALNSEVYVITVSGSNVYVGGEFEDVNNNGTELSAADYIARWDGTNWSALGGTNTNDGAIDAWVGAIAVYGANVYIGGGFTNVQNNATILTTADYIAKWDGANWSAMGGTNLNNGAFTGEVYALAVDNSGNVYAGGAFTDVRMGLFSLLTADYIAKWDGTSWSNLGSNGASNGSLTSPVNQIAVAASGDVYVVGSFENVNNNGVPLGAADGIAQWDGANWSALGSDGAGNGAVHLKYGIYDLALSGTTVYVVGSFSYVTNGGVPLPQAANVAQWDGVNWSALNSNGAANGSLNGDVYAMVVDGTDVYIGGAFTDVVDQGVVLPAADFVAKWDGSHWSALGSNGAGDGALNDRIVTMTFTNNTLYIGGVFTNVNNNGVVLPAADYVAKWDGHNWSALGSGAGGNGALNSAVSVLATIGNDVYAGGEFSNVNNNGTVLTAADYIARWNGTNWSALGSNGAGEGSLDLYVNSMATAGPLLFVGGQFSNVNNNGVVLSAADKVAQWNGTNWSALGSNGSGNGSIDCGVWALTVSLPYLYAGGCFTDINNYGTTLTAADYIAQWDGTNWSALGSDGTHDGALSFVVGDIAANGSDIFVAGRFENVTNNGTVLTAADYVAHWDGTNWSALGDNGANDGSLNCEAATLRASNDNLYVGGCFTDVNNNGSTLPEADYVAVYHILRQKLYLPVVQRP